MPTFDDDEQIKLDIMTDQELAKYFADTIMEKFVKNYVVDYNACYDQIYNIALRVKCAIIFKKAS